MADNLGIDVPPGLDRPFIIEEILEAETDEGSREEALFAGAEFLEPVPLPEQYNITYIKILIRDPLWVFAFWEIKSHDREVYENIQNFEGYFLKVVPVEGEYSGYTPLAEDAKASPSLPKAVFDLSFTVQVGIDDSAWYLGFPPDYSGKNACGGGWFRVELGVRWGAEQAVLAASKPFRLPSLLLPAAAKAPRSPLADLSGMDELRILRNGDRRSRIPRDW
ncbi:MAG: DUF4912 domain-containing protein [Treponema sp.]|nr:DUF4912 domain-containing protein [Treponema sp.]